MFTRIQVFFGKDKGWWGSDGHHHQFGQWVRQPDRWLNLDMKHHHYERRCAVCGAVFQSTFGDDQKYLGVPKGGKE